MRHTTTVNKFEVEFYDDGYPMWTSIKYDGKEVLRIHHNEIQDLEYAMNRTRHIAKAKLPVGDKWEI